MLRDLEKLRLAPVNAEKEWEKSQWELTNSAELEAGSEKICPSEAGRLYGAHPCGRRPSD